jgi:EpsI family protein
VPRYVLPAAALFLMLAICTAAAAHIAMRGLRVVEAGQMQVLGAIPGKVGHWTMVPMLIDPVQPSLVDALGQPVLVYDRIETRSFRRDDGTTIMLMLAYRRQQHQEDRVHSPELCYIAQGYVLDGARDVPIQTAAGPISARSFTAEGIDRREQVLYWIRTGDLISNQALNVRWEIFSEGLNGKLLDGLLVRASIVRPAGQAISAAADEKMLRAFLTELVSSSPSTLTRMLMGSDPTAT